MLIPHIALLLCYLPKRQLSWYDILLLCYPTPCDSPVASSSPVSALCLWHVIAPLCRSAAAVCVPAVKPSLSSATTGVPIPATDISNTWRQQRSAWSSKHSPAAEFVRDYYLIHNFPHNVFYHFFRRKRQLARIRYIQNHGIFALRPMASREIFMIVVIRPPMANFVWKARLRLSKSITWNLK